MRSGSGTIIPHWWRCWRNSPLSRCPPLCCSLSCPCCSLATTPSAPPQRCTQERSTSQWLWSLTVPEVRTCSFEDLFHFRNGSNNADQRFKGSARAAADVLCCLEEKTLAILLGINDYYLDTSIKMLNKLNHIQ